jgi:hypothetical protein
MTVQSELVRAPTISREHMVATRRFAGAAPALLRATAPAVLRVPARRIGAAAPANSLHSLARLPRAPPPLAARCRLLCSTADAISKFTDDFTEAQLLLGDAEEVVGTTYFEEDLAEAKELTESVVKQFDDLLAAAPTAEEKETLTNRFGLSIRGLKDKLHAREEQLH